MGRNDRRWSTRRCPASAGPLIISLSRGLLFQLRFRTISSSFLRQLLEFGMDLKDDVLQLFPLLWRLLVCENGSGYIATEFVGNGHCSIGLYETCRGNF